MNTRVFRQLKRGGLAACPPAQVYTHAAQIISQMNYRSRHGLLLLLDGPPLRVPKN